jgi:hypothetical protein
MHQLFAAGASDMTPERPSDPHRGHAADLARDRRAQRRSVRYRAAMVLTRLSLASAAVVRRLDACVADDLHRRLALTDGR